MEKKENEIFNQLQHLDSMTYNHSRRVKDICQAIESDFGLNDHVLTQAALYHDIGKIYIPMRIIDKPGSLSILERNIIDLHSYFGFEVLKELGMDEAVCQVVLHHHGMNPPVLNPQDTLTEFTDQTKMEWYAHILHTVDAYEALTTDRPYRRGHTSAEAITIMKQEGGYVDEVILLIQKLMR